MTLKITTVPPSLTGDGTELYSRVYSERYIHDGTGIPTGTAVFQLYALFIITT